MAGCPELPCCPHCSGSSGAQTFGVRSYLHLFYEDCTFSAPQDQAELQPKRAPVSRTSWPSLLWKACLTTGVLLAVTGGLALAMGVLVPPRIEGFGEGELLVVDERAIRHNRALAACRMAGGLLLALGGTPLLACVLALPVCRVMERIRDNSFSSSSSPCCCTPDSRPICRRVPNTRFTPCVSPIHTALPIALSPKLSIQPRARP
ncbi:neurensin-1 [Amia ocellicauda]|uniref:neurensin-1 n=1 Tax=Amia ocellicauda TaxID=2972642 RepID=UPI003464E314|nr:NRSN1 protein [Amia calva]